MTTNRSSGRATAPPSAVVAVLVTVGEAGGDLTDGVQTASIAYLMSCDLPSSLLQLGFSRCHVTDWDGDLHHSNGKHPHHRIEDDMIKPFLALKDVKYL